MSSKHTTLLTKTDAVSMVYNRHHRIMARSTYVFPTEEDYNDARDHIYQTMRDDYYDNSRSCSGRYVLSEQQSAPEPSLPAEFK